MNEGSTHTGRRRMARVLADLTKRVFSNLITKLVLLAIASYWVFTGGIGAIQSIWVFKFVIYLTVSISSWLLLKWTSRRVLTRIATRNRVGRAKATMLQRTTSYFTQRPLSLNMFIVLLAIGLGIIGTDSFWDMKVRFRDGTFGVVITTFRGNELKDTFGKEGCTRALVNDLNSEIVNSRSGSLIKVRFIPISVSDSVQARELAKRLNAAAVVWGTWQSNTEQTGLKLGIRTGYFRIRHGESQTFFSVEDITEGVFPTNRLVSTYTELQQSLYLLVRYLSFFFATSRFDSKEAIEYMEALQAEISGHFDDMLTSYLNEELSVLYLGGGEYSKADRLLDKCLACFSKQPVLHGWDISDCYAQKAFISLRKKQFREAENYLRLSHDSGPYLWQAQPLWAELFYETARSDRLEQLVSDLRKVYPDSTIIFEICGGYLAKLGRPKEGMLCLLHADTVKGDFDSPEHLYHLGGLSLLSKELVQAKLNFERCLYLSPCYVRCLVRLVATYAELGRFEEALALIRSCPIPNVFETNDLMFQRFVCFSRTAKLDSLSIYLPAYIESTGVLLASLHGQDSVLIASKLRFAKGAWRQFQVDRATSPQMKSFEIF
ncbi:MAG: tetratricopeptide repeat protein [candidate division Zixibacteria bacterium]|nr:tetratricopeptide repeat protein [candidate division Zixibacteria bacterium]